MARQATRRSVPRLIKTSGLLSFITLPAARVFRRMVFVRIPLPPELSPVAVF
jgi:hypothetical protein